MKKNNLEKVLEKLHNRLPYKKLDEDALDISRACAAGNLGLKDNFQEWSMLTDNPLVVVNYIKTFVTNLTSMLASSPYRPENDNLMNLGIGLRINSVFTSMYEGVLNDGYNFLGVGIRDGKPEVRAIDPRYILFNGDDPTLKDSTNVVIFEVRPKAKTDNVSFADPIPTSYVKYDQDTEQVIVSHYHKVVQDGVPSIILEVYENTEDDPKPYPLKGLDRIPVVRFVGERVELSDKRYHYRGIYYQLYSVLKALSVTATKAQIRLVSSDDSSYLVDKGSIMNHPEWENSGAKPYDSVDDNGNEMKPPVPVTHDNQFIIQSFEMWKTVISDMLGPVVQSGSEAVTREEVHARNEVRDAIANTYLERMVNSISEVYRCIAMFMYGDTKPIVVVGGYIDQVKRTKQIQELDVIYMKAKEAGLNTQGFISEYVKFSDLPTDTKQAIMGTIMTDPFASPITQQLKAEIAQRDQIISDMKMKQAVLELKASTRAEHQDSYIDMTERTKNAEIMFNKWQQEQKETQQGRMEILRAFLNRGDIQSALAMLGQMSSIDPVPISTTTVLDQSVSNQTNEMVTQADALQIESAKEKLMNEQQQAQGVNNGMA